jgi:ceramide glucosyltransferase
MAIELDDGDCCNMEGPRPWRIRHIGHKPPMKRVCRTIRLGRELLSPDSGRIAAGPARERADVLILLGWTFLTLGLIGAGYALFASRQVKRYLGRKVERQVWPRLPFVTILKPLHGAEPGLYANLESFCLQDYAGRVQIVCGVHDIGDQAVRIVRELQRAYPCVDIALVVDNRLHGENRKVCNLVNMQSAIRGEVVVVSDSDIRVGRTYLNEVVAPLADPSLGFVTCLYTGAPTASLWSRLSAMGINYQFLPNVLAGLRLGMAHPCFGATVALRRDVLDQVGGFAILADQLADDYDLGRAVREAGYRGQVAQCVVVHTCHERDGAELWSHESRWSRTIRLIDPFGFGGSAVTYALPWAMIGCLLAFSPAAVIMLLAVAAARLHLAHVVDRATETRAAPLYLLPLRDLFSFAVFLSAFSSRTVSWRGRRYRVGSDGALEPAQESIDASHPVPSSAFLRRLRWRRRIALSSQARDQVVLVSDLAGSAGRFGREQPANRRPAA